MRVGYRLGLAACLIAGGVAHAQPVPQPEPASLCPPCLHDEILKGLPLNIEAVVAVNGGARQRTSAAGRAFTGMLENSSALAETVQAWQLLAKTLSWTPERTFDEVLGRRVSLVMRGLEVDAAGGPDWALMSEVSTETQRHLRERLKAAPRGAIAGMPVLSIEDGSFEFVVSPERAQSGGRGAIILLAPRRSENMLDELAPALDVIPAAQGNAGRKACDVVVAWNRAASGQRSAQTLTISASAIETGWDASIVCSPSLVLNHGAAKPRRWTDSAFKSLETGSLLAVMSSGGSGVAVEPVAFIPPAIRSWVDELWGVVGSGESGLRIAAFVRASGPMPARPAAAVGGTEKLAPRSDAGAFQGRLAVTVAAETADPRAALVKGDRAIAQFAQVLMSGRPQAGELVPGVQLEVADRGARCLKIGEALVVHPDIEPSLTRAFGQNPVLVWNTVTSSRARASGEGAGWWVASLSGAFAGDREARALSGPESGPGKSRLCVGIVRPAAIDRWVAALEPEIVGPIPGAAFIDSLRWDFWVRDDGQVEGAVNLRMAPPSAPPATTPPAANK